MQLFLAKMGRQTLLLAVSGVLTVFLAACTSTGLQDIAPQAAPLPAPAAPLPTPAPRGQAAPETAAQPASAVSGPAVTGEFPNLNTAPDKAAAEMSEPEKAALIAELNAARAANAAGPSAAGAAKVARLRELARRHGAAALKEIEK